MYIDIYTHTHRTLMHAALISRAPHPRLACRPPCPAAGQVLRALLLQGLRPRVNPRQDRRAPTSSGQPSRLVADGTTSYANQRLASAGTVLYRIVWSGFPADLWYYEPAKNLGADLVAAFGEAEVAQAAAEAKEKADLLELEAADAAARSQGMGV